jgi:hypothetical protein
MLGLSVLFLYASGGLVPLVDGIVPGKTEIPTLVKRFGRAVRSGGRHPGSVHTWNLKGGLILQVDAFELGKSGDVAQSVGVVAWNGSLKKALGVNGLATKIKPLESLRVGTRDTSVAKTLHMVLGKAPGQRLTHHFTIGDMFQSRSWANLRFGWSKKNKLEEIVQTSFFK